MSSIANIENLVGPPIEVTDTLLERCREKGQFGPLTFELYKETAGLVCVSSGAYFAPAELEMKLGRNQAICAGLLVRISKYMLSVIKLSADIEHGETVESLNRCIIESTVNLQYLLLKDEGAIYDRFVKKSLVAERELYDMIQENVQSRGGDQFAIEQSMLKSIANTCQQSGIDVEDIDPKPGSWGGSFRDKLTALGFDWTGYTALERIPSHAVHGDWVDLVLNHLFWKEDGFELNFDHLTTDGELLTPVGLFAIEAARQYLDKYFARDIAYPLHDRLGSVQARLMKVETSRADWRTVS